MSFSSLKQPCRIRCSSSARILSLFSILNTSEQKAVGRLVPDSVRFLNIQTKFLRDVRPVFIFLKVNLDSRYLLIFAEENSMMMMLSIANYISRSFCRTDQSNINIVFYCIALFLIYIFYTF